MRRGKRVSDFRYRLLPVFSNLIEPDAVMQALIDGLREPYLAKLQQPLAVTESLLYRRDTFAGSFDQIILDALRQINNAQIALSPGFRWGACVLPGQTVSMEDVFNQTAITYPQTYTRTLTGRQLKQILEDVSDNLFHENPYYRQGGDMVRVGGLCYRCRPNAAFGQRIDDLRLNNGEPLSAHKYYSVSGWATVGQASPGPPVWDVVTSYLKDKQTLAVEPVQRPDFIL